MTIAEEPKDIVVELRKTHEDAVLNYELAKLSGDSDMIHAAASTLASCRLAFWDALLEFGDPIVDRAPDDLEYDVDVTTLGFDG